MKFTTTLVVAALLAAGSAQAQLKAPPPDVSGPVVVTPPAGSKPGGNIVQPNAPDPLSAEFHTCIQKVQDAAQKTKQPDAAAAQACFVAETKRQEAKIAAGVNRVAKGLTNNEKKHLDESNVAWRHFRDAECAFFAEPKGSPGEQATNAQCTLDRTIRRSLDMEGLAQALAERDVKPPASTAPAKK
jgi:uncharacterized protein YecT (DUF1311 family)